MNIPREGATVKVMENGDGEMDSWDALKWETVTFTELLGILNAISP